MNFPAIEDISYEKGWGVFFDVRDRAQTHRFSISMKTLTTPGLLHRTKLTFPEVFDANTATMLKIAELLIRSNRLQQAIDIGGTEILPEHIVEITGRVA